MLLIDTIRKLAEENSDAVYNISGTDLDSCAYTKGPCGPGVGCIVGQAVAQCYPDKIPQMVAQDDERPVGAATLLYDLGIEYSEKEIRWINTVQAKQDIGYRWTAAVNMADTVQEETERFF